MLKTVSVLVLALLVGCHGMRSHDAYLELANYSALYVDYLQTDAIAQTCDQYTEVNPLIDTCERPGPLDAASYFALSLLAHTIATAALPEGKWRTTFQAFSLGLVVKGVYRNHTDGVRIE